MSAKFATVVLDVDSTLAGIEGIDWLAERRGADVAARVAKLTEDAMHGVIPLESVYGARLEAIRPTLADIEALGTEYVRQQAVGSGAAVRAIRDAGVDVVLVSGGIRQAIAPLARAVGLDSGDVNAVRLRFDGHGDYLSYDAASPLATSDGKRTVVAQLQLKRPILAVGDGATDVAMRDVVDLFAAYVGFARRDAVVAQAGMVLENFSALAALVLDK